MEVLVSTAASSTPLSFARVHSRRPSTYVPVRVPARGWRCRSAAPAAPDPVSSEEPASGTTVVVADKPAEEPEVGAVSDGSGVAVEATVVDAPVSSTVEAPEESGGILSKLTALGYVVASIPMLFHGDTLPAVINKGLRAPILSVKILAISVKFSSKEDMEKVISLLEFFPFLETLHVQASDANYKSAAEENHTIVSDYYQQCDPIRCVTRHLKRVRLECGHHSRSMLEFACFLLARAHVLQFMKIQSAMSGLPDWVTQQQNLLKQSHVASLDAEVVFENAKCRGNFTIEAVEALSDPFDGDIKIMGY